LGLENWVSRTNYPALGIVPTGDGEMSFYVQRNYGQPTASLKRYKMRTDGFASICAPYSGGEMITKPIVIPDRGQTTKLALNFATSAAGSIRVGLIDAAGGEADQFSVQACDELIGDRINRIVRWNGKSDLKDLAGQTIRLKFVMKDANLYALQFQ
jgi:hypothetical protein